MCDYVLLWRTMEGICLETIYEIIRVMTTTKSSKICNNFQIMFNK